MPADFFYEMAEPGIIAGVDEAGRGPLAGPVVAAAVILPRKKLPRGIDDSKALTPEQRAKLFKRLIAIAEFGIGIASVEEIDRINILQASLLAMSRAVGQLPRRPDHALIDGNRTPDIPCAATAIIAGDALSLSIAAASIIAKVTRDRLMCELACNHPGYGWERNFGYATACHREAIRTLGITVMHRRSFDPVRTMLTQTELFDAA